MDKDFKNMFPQLMDKIQFFKTFMLKRHQIYNGIM